MPHTRTCPQGHDWDGHPDDCPQCAADESSLAGDGRSTVDSINRDELPPLPSSVRIASKPKPIEAKAVSSGPLPFIPGYAVLNEVGRGGMGTVYRARQIALNRIVALKVLTSGTNDPSAVERFRAEAAAVAHVEHPNIAHIFDVGEFDGRPYLALEFIEGGTLHRALAGKPMEARAAAQLIEILARTVQFAHERGIIHRDLKPGNILLQRNDGDGDFSRPKIVDFGLAKRLNGDATQTTTGVAVGTPSYMSPEQAAGWTKLVGPSSDIYALGAILYELLTGRPPFHAASAVETLQQVVANEAVAPAQLQPGVPRDLETICLKCLQKEIRRRYASAGELADDLRRFLDGRPIMARRVTVWERGLKWARRRPAAATLIAVVVAAIVALTALGIRHNRALEKHNEELATAAANLARERDEAQRQSERAEINLKSANDAIEQMLKRVGIDRLESTPFMDRVRVELLEDALRFFDKLLEVQSDDRRLRIQRAHTLELCGRLKKALGRFPEALERYDAALALANELLAEPDSPVPERTLLWLQSMILNNRSLVYQDLGEPAKARADQEAALARREKLLDLEPDNPQFIYDVAASHLNMSRLAIQERKREDQQLYLGRALPRAESLVQDHPEENRHWFLLGLILHEFGGSRQEAGEKQLAAEYFERSVQVWRKLIVLEPGHVYYRSELARALTNYSNILLIQGFRRRAHAPLDEALRIRQKLAADHPDVWMAAVGLCHSLLIKAELHHSSDEFDDAIKHYDEVIERLERVRVHGDFNARSMLADSYFGRAKSFTAQDKYPEALVALKKSIEVSEPHVRAERQLIRAFFLSQRGNVPDLVEALKEANIALEFPEHRPVQYFQAATVFAMSMAIEMDADKKEKLALRAIELLGLAQKGGYFRDEARRKQFDQNNNFKLLRGRDEFAKLRQKMNGD